MSQTISKCAAAVLALLAVLLLPACGRHCEPCTDAACSSAPGEVGEMHETPPPAPAAPATDVKPVTELKVESVKPVVIPPPPADTKAKPPPERNAAETEKGNVERKAIRIRAGSVSEWKDKAGNVWLPDAGFIEGAMVDRGRGAIERTDNPELYSTERCCMEKFVWPVPNGKYKIALHFAETFEDVKKSGERVFSMDVAGQKVKDFDIFKEAGGANKALVKTYHVTVTGGKFEIVFAKSEQKEPAINGIEILPE